MAALTTIADLGDELLSEIFVRLPPYREVINCKFVSKHWLSLLSNPNFIARFLNQKKTQLAWTFLSTVQMGSLQISDGKRPTHNIFDFSKFCLKFLPFTFKVVATFKELILCIDVDATNTYYICNPLTKKWVVLPRSPLPYNNQEQTWVALICEDYQGCVDYKFRVVIVDPIPKGYPINNDPFKVFNLMVFCSENSQWKEVNLKVSLAKRRVHSFMSANTVPFMGVICRGMVCLRHNTYFGIFNPFEVTPNTSNSVEARNLPLFPRGKLFECGGRLFAIRPLYHHLIYKSERLDQISMAMTILELDLNNDRGDWGRMFKGSCSSAKRSSITPWGSRLLGMHPRNKNLLYVLNDENELILCDIRPSKLKLESLGRLAPDHIDSCHRLELQYWPTPVPHLDVI